MDNKQIWTTVIVAVVVAVVVSWLVSLSVVGGPNLAPFNASVKKSSNITLTETPLPDLIVSSFGSVGGGCGASNQTVRCTVYMLAAITNIGNLRARDSHTYVHIQLVNQTANQTVEFNTWQLPLPLTLARALHLTSRLPISLVDSITDLRLQMVLMK